MTDPFGIPNARRPSPLPLVEAIRAEVDAWRGSYTGLSDTTRRLFEHWFLDEHETADGDRFAYYFAQREAIETIVYLQEVVGIRSTTDLLNRYSINEVPSDVPYTRYVVKMATGSGKTKVMALAIVWSYFHSLTDADSGMSPNSLVVAPNLIVFERLRIDFEHARIFHEDPMIPPEWRKDFDLQVVMRHDPVPVSAPGFLCLTNVHLLYDRPAPKPANPVAGLLGPKPPANPFALDPLLLRLAERGRLLVINDEAHHLHDEIRSDTGEPLEVLKSLRRLHELSNEGVVAQLDMSATPKGQKGQLFPEIVSDYPLSAAIDDGIVKRPIFGELSGDVETPSDDAGVRYRQRILAGVAKWREMRDAMAPAGRTPLLFVMAEDTKSADQIDAFLNTLPDLAGAVLTIHVNMSGKNAGEIKADDLEKARQAARDVDRDDSPYSAIVSVLMLREGWDVRNVCVIVPLRPFTAKSNILPEQTLGRGLRRMTPPGSGFEERVVIIEHDAFRTLWESELAKEGLEIDFVPPDDIKIDAQVIAVDPGRVPELDIAVPQLSRRLRRAAGSLSEIDFARLPDGALVLPESTSDPIVRYTGRDLRTGEIVERADYPLPVADDIRTVLGWYAERLQANARMTGQFHVLLPIVRTYVERKAFGAPVDLDDSRVSRALAEPVAQESILGVLKHAVDEATLLDAAAVIERAPVAISTTRPFLWSKEVAVATRSVFPLQPCDSGLEVQMVGFLDRCSDVASFAKLAPAARVSMEYRNADGRLAFYFPDFLVRLDDDRHFLVETKGVVDLDVPEKDRRAAQWALDATLSAHVRWEYVRVDQDLFDEHSSRLSAFDGLVATVRARERAKLLSEISPAGKRTPKELLALMDEVRQRTRGSDIDVDAELRRQRDEH